MFRRGNPFVRAREETSSTCRASHLRTGPSLSWPSHVHIQPNLLKSCHLMQAITDYKTDGHAVTHANPHITITGKQHLRKTTKGWHLCIQWKDRTTSWERLADVKESNPIEVAEYAMAQGIDHKPAFTWWVPYTLKEEKPHDCGCIHVISQDNSQILLQVPKNIAECEAIDKENRNTLWMQ